MSYIQDVKKVESLRVSEGSRERKNCPFCSGIKTLLVSNVSGRLDWFCFKASCKASGVFEGERSAASIRAFLKPSTTIQATYEVPEYFTSPLGNANALQYLERYHCSAAYGSGLADIRYDPKQDRVVFMVQDGGRVVDGAGRALKYGVKPKWLRYAASEDPFVCGTSDVAVIVEDCSSACAVSGVATGVALLGTNVKATFIGGLRRFRKVLVALDKDATRKALDIQRMLSFYVPTQVLRLEEDLKYLNTLQISEMLSGKT